MGSGQKSMCSNETSILYGVCRLYGANDRTADTPFETKHFNESPKFKSFLRASSACPGRGMCCLAFYFNHLELSAGWGHFQN